MPCPEVSLFKKWQHSFLFKSCICYLWMHNKSVRKHTWMPERSWNYFSPSSFQLALGSEPMWSGLCSKYLSLSHRANNGVTVLLVLCHIAHGPFFHWPKDFTKPLICCASFHLRRSNDQDWILVFLLVWRSIMGPSVRNQVNIIPMSNIPCESSWISTSGTLLQRHPTLPCINPLPVHFFFSLPAFSGKCHCYPFLTIL